MIICDLGLKIFNTTKLGKLKFLKNWWEGRRAVMVNAVQQIMDKIATAKKMASMDGIFLKKH